MDCRFRSQRLRWGIELATDVCRVRWRKVCLYSGPNVFVCAHLHTNLTHQKTHSIIMRTSILLFTPINLPLRHQMLISKSHVHMIYRPSPSLRLRDASHSISSICSNNNNNNYHSLQHTTTLNLLSHSLHLTRAHKSNPPQSLPSFYPSYLHTPKDGS